jgi:hypothetical protein
VGARASHSRDPTDPTGGAGHGHFVSWRVVAIIPDDKDWTWVLRRRCPECGFDSTSLPRHDIAPLIRTNAAQWQAVLETRPALLRRRVRPDRWSPLEYACHVRDVFRIYDERLRLMLTEDEPLYANWDQDTTAVADRYNDQDPVATAAQLAVAADTLAARFDTVAGGAWDRRGSRSDGASFSVESFGRYMIHDPVHHLHDVNGDIAALMAEEID